MKKLNEMDIFIMFERNNKSFHVKALYENGDFLKHFCFSFN
jgi:hypothetical protein